ncbi:MAG TPA: adenine deaminase [Clostridia bacterium]|nr:adenine deaminase [Clostridia bacterium]
MRTVPEINTLIDCGLGKIPCDLVLRNVKLVNVCSKEIYETDIYIKGKRIVSIEPGAKLTAEKEIDCGGLYALPGFIDGHMHYSSSMINPEAMAQAIVPQGTTTLCVDFMEISNVTGGEIIDVMLENADKLPYRIAIEVPTRVPTAPGLETTGKVIGVEETKKLLGLDATVALGEVAPAKILQRTDDNIQKICDAINMGKVVNGHAVGCNFQELSVYASAGVTDDHEPVEWEEALNRLRLGMHVMVREGSGARNLKMFVENALKLGYSFENTFFCTDDKHITDINEEGHINHNVNLAIKLGVDPMTAISMATINAAKHFRVEQDYGSITPGRFADIILCESIEKVQPKAVYFEGRKVFEKDVMPVAKIERVYPEWVRDTVHFKKPITAESFKVPAPAGKDSVTVNIAELVDDQIVNKWKTAVLPVKDGLVMRDPENDIMKFAVCERYGKNGNVNVAFVKNFKLKKGAVAYSMSHNHQNVCVLGASDEDMAVAVNEVANIKGGLVTVIDGKVIASMPLRIGGLISEELEANTIAEQLTAMNESAKETGCTLPAPFMTLSFIAHPAIPELAPTDMGLVDVSKQEFISLIVE